MIRIAPSRKIRSIDLGAIWEYRDLLYFLAWRDIKVRYKQTFLGAFWAIAQPLMAMAIFTVIFGRLAKISSDGVPYPVFCLCAIIPWNYFSAALSRASSSLVGSANLISKVYFPRLVIPISSLLSGLLDLAISFIVLIGAMLWYRITPTINIFWLPFFLLMAVAFALAVGLWLGALNVRYRDVGYIVPFLVQIWMYATPIIYPVSIIPDRWRFMYGLNPMVGVIEGFRWSLLGQGAVPAQMLIISIAIIFISLICGAYYFRMVEGIFADVI
jgi:lipopolysaccharide transport system permease protein